MIIKERNERKDKKGSLFYMFECIKWKLFYNIILFCSSQKAIKMFYFIICMLCICLLIHLTVRKKELSEWKHYFSVFCFLPRLSCLSKFSSCTAKNDFRKNLFFWKKENDFFSTFNPFILHTYQFSFSEERRNPFILIFNRIPLSL